MPANNMAQYRDPVVRLFVHVFVSQSVNICVNPYFDPNVQVHFPRTIKVTVMILGISLHLLMTSQTAVSIFDLDLYFMVPGLCKFFRISPCQTEPFEILLPCRCDLAFGGILVHKRNIFTFEQIVFPLDLISTFSQLTFRFYGDVSVTNVVE